MTLVSRWFWFRVSRCCCDVPMFFSPRRSVRESRERLGLDVAPARAAHRPGSRRHDAARGALPPRPPRRPRLRQLRRRLRHLQGLPEEGERHRRGNSRRDVTGARPRRVRPVVAVFR